MKLIAKWGKPDHDSDPDVIADGDVPRSHKRLLIHRLCFEHSWADGCEMPSLVDELERLGYDITTLRFSVQMKKGTKP